MFSRHKSTKETVKTIVQEMPDVSGGPVVTNARAFYTTRAAAGALSARHFLRLLLKVACALFFGANTHSKTRAHRVARSRICACLPSGHNLMSRSSRTMTGQVAQRLFVRDAPLVSDASRNASIPRCATG